MTRRYGSIDRDLFQRQLAGISEEMSQAVRRTSHSSIIWDMYDYAVALFSPNGEMLAQADTIPAQLGTMSTALRAMWKKHPLASWKPGDVFVCNDPYLGCTHTPDITLFSPVYLGDRIIAVASTIAHHIDIGGPVPSTTSPDTTSVFGEGLIFPQIRLVEEGRPNETLFEVIRANVRNPRACIGDIRAQIAGCRTAERRLETLGAHYGPEAFAQLAAECLDYGERYVRAAIAEAADGRHEAEILIEDGIARQDHIRMHVMVEIDGSDIRVDFTGSSAQRENAMNCPWSSTVSMTSYAIKCLTAPDILMNDGCNRPLSLHAPTGSVLNPARPAAVGRRHHSQQAVADVVLKALAPAFPGRGAAGSHISFPSFRLAGVDDRPRALRRSNTPQNFVISDLLGGGMGASASTDGLDAVDTHAGNCGLLSAEVMETFSAVRVRASRMVNGSGGVGEYRGGLAIEREYELLSSEGMMSCQAQQTKDETAPWGACGGGPGGKAQAVLHPDTPEATVLPARNKHRKLHRGDVVRVRSAGGGGYGDPARRDPAQHAHDLAEGYL